MSDLLTKKKIAGKKHTLAYGDAKKQERYEVLSTSY
jgi:hypothetical protein